MTKYSLVCILEMCSISNFQPVHFSMSSSYCFFISHLQVSQETGKVVWYSHLFKNIPQLMLSPQSKSLIVVNTTEVDILLQFPSFSMIQQISMISMIQQI